LAISVLELFRVGIGPSSSHTVGPMRAARQFASLLREAGLLDRTSAVQAQLYGSLGATGRGHGSDKAVMLGLEGEEPERIDPDTIEARLARIRERGALDLLGQHPIAFLEREHLVFHRRESLPFHPNGMRFAARGLTGEELAAKQYYSVGGGFVVDEQAAGADRIREDDRPLPHPFRTGAELLELCHSRDLAISQVMIENEAAWRSEAQTRAQLARIWQAMQDCVKRGCSREGVLPGAIKLRRRAAELYRQLSAAPEAALRDPLTILDWVNLYALAVNEENAAGGRVVTAPTNGAAGIIPAVLHYYDRFIAGASPDGARDRHPVQAERLDLRRRGRMPGRGRCRLLDGGGRTGRGAGRHARAGGERGRDRHGAQPRTDVRSGRRPGAGALHRAQRDGLGEGHQRRTDGAARGWQALRVARQGDQDDA